MRIKRGTTKHARHRKVVNAAKGYRLSYSKLYKRAKEAGLHAGQYSFNHRKKRASQFRELWITRINAALTQYNLKYNKFIQALTTNKIELNRKMLAFLALDEAKTFAEIVKVVNK
jgi:large subunit ribosomal protein L20